MRDLNDRRLIFFVGVNTGFVRNEHPDARFVEFYRSRASPDLHCSIVGNVIIPGGHGSNASTPRISRDEVWGDLAAAIAARGTLPGIQLATAWEGYRGSTSFKSKQPARVVDDARTLISGMDFRAIDATLTNLEVASEIALMAGFKHLQLHAAHGYLLSLLVDRRLNRHADKVLTRIANWANAVRQDAAESSIRFSLSTGDAHFDGIGRSEFHREIAELPVDYVDVSSGFYNIDKRLIYPSRHEILEQRREETIALALSYPAQRFILSGRAGEQRIQDLPRNVHIGLCRDLIANPNFLATWENGCVNSGKCHYFSRGEPHLQCSQWVRRHI